MSSAFKEKMRDEKMDAEEKGLGFFFFEKFSSKKKGREKQRD